MDASKAEECGRRAKGTQCRLEDRPQSRIRVEEPVGRACSPLSTPDLSPLTLLRTQTLTGSMLRAARARPPRLRASPLASTSALTIDHLTTHRAAPAHTGRDYTSHGGVAVNRPSPSSSGLEGLPHLARKDDESEVHLLPRQSKRAPARGEYSWVIDAPRPSTSRPAVSADQEEGPPDPFLGSLLARHDHVAALRYTDEAIAAGLPSVSPSFLAARLRAILSNSAFDRLASTHALFEQCVPAPRAEHYDLLMQAYLAASNVAAAKDVYRSASARGLASGFDTQKNIILGYKAAYSGMGALRTMMRYANKLANEKDAEGLEDLVAAWIEVNVQWKGWQRAEVWLRRFDFRGLVDLPSADPLGRIGGEDDLGSIRTGSLRPTNAVCVAGMKLYNALERPDVVQAIWHAITKLGLEPDAPAFIELLQSLELVEALDILGQVSPRYLSPDAFPPLLSAVYQRYGVQGIDGLLSWMNEAGIRPTPGFLTSTLEALTLEPGMTPARIADACLRAHDASEGALVLSDQHALVILQFAAEWAEGKLDDRIRKTFPRRTAPASHGRPVLSPLLPHRRIGYREATEGLKKEPSRRKRAQTVWLEQLRRAHVEAERLNRPALASETLDPDDPQLGLDKIVRILDLCYPEGVNPSNRTVSAMMHLAAFTGRAGPDLFKILKAKVIDQSLTPHQSHLRALVMSSIFHGGSFKATDRAFRESNEYARRSGIVFAGALVALFVTALVAARQPLVALTLFSQAEWANAPLDQERRLSPDAYLAATTAAAAAGDVDQMRRLHAEMQERFPYHRHPRSEALYFTTLFESLMRLQEPNEAQDEAMKALTCGLTPDEKVMKVIVDSGKKLRKTVRRLQRVKASLIAGGAVPVSDLDGEEPSGLSIDDAALSASSSKVDRIRYSWQLQHVERRLVSLNRAVQLQAQVESLARERMIAGGGPSQADDGEAVQRVAGRIGELSRVPSWFQWQREKNEIEKRGGVRKPLYGALEEALQSRRDARAKTADSA